MITVRSLFADLAGAILGAPPRCGDTRLVAVDGPSGAGKTVFAERLARTLREAGASVQIVHTDDLLDGWGDELTFWPRLERQILAPLRRGETGAYQRFDWIAQRFAGASVPVPAGGVLIIEGVTSARAAIRAELSRSVFVSAPPALRLARAVARDGEAIRPYLVTWRRVEADFFAADGTHSAADLVVDGAPEQPHDPVHEFIQLAGRLPLAMPMNESQLRTALATHLPGVRADLENLVRIPGIAFDGFDHSHLERSAEAVAELLREAGLPDVKIVRSGGQPAVIGSRPAPPGAPTVLLYAHHDVQPVGDLSQWESDPFLATERDGRLYGRGAADDKAGIMAHVAALRAFGEELPVGVVVFVEGEEEFGSASLERMLHEHREELAADVIVIADSANWAIGQPALTTSLRGIVNLFVEVGTLDHAVHSGMFGGAVPDALTALTRLLATLHDDAGEVAVAGLVARPATPLDYPEARFRAEAGLLDGVCLIGTGRIVERIWTRPSLAILGIDAPPTQEAPNALVPTAKAKISLRIAPGDDPTSAFAAVQTHLEKYAPWGAHISVTLEQDGNPCVIDATGPGYDAARAAFAAAWDGVAPVDIGVGGSIPFISTFAELFPHAAILVTGVEDPDSRAHGPNESLHLGEFARVCLAEALLLAKVAELVPPRR